MEQRELDLLRAKVKALERRLQLIVIACLLTIVSLLVLGLGVQQGISQPEVIRAREIQVIDRKGKLRAIIGMLEPENAVRLTLFSSGKPGASLAVSEDHVGLQLDSPRGRRRFLLLATEELVSLHLAGPQGEAAAFVGGKGKAIWTIGNARSNVQVGMFASHEGPGLVLSRGGTTLFQAP
jgi:hypothetical protein